MDFLFFPPLPCRIQWQSSESFVGFRQCRTSCSAFLLWAPGCQHLTGHLYYSLTCRTTTPPWRHRGPYQMSCGVSSQPTKLWEKHWADRQYAIVHFLRMKERVGICVSEMHCTSNKDLSGVADLHTMASYIFLPQLAVLPCGSGWTVAGHHQWFHHSCGPTEAWPGLFKCCCGEQHCTTLSR